MDGWVATTQRQRLFHSPIDKCKINIKIYNGANKRKVWPVKSASAVPGPLFLSSGADLLARGNFNWSGSFIPFPFSRDESSLKRTPPLVRVRLSVEYRVHSRQMLCVGGSAIPLGWSFLSIAKVPMAWQPTDVWMVDIELPAGTRVEYKYVILEEQDWTRQVNEAAEGRVEYSYRTAPDASPPDVQRITKQMAIVAWQAGPNRVLQVPSENELSSLKMGEGPVHRIPPPSFVGQTYSTQAAKESSTREVWERLSIDENGRPFLERHDVWGTGESPRR
jgi:hypothetical protein